jgi:hypothetical protein
VPLLLLPLGARPSQLHLPGRRRPLPLPPRPAPLLRPVLPRQRRRLLLRLLRAVRLRRALCVLAEA